MATEVLAEVTLHGRRFGITTDGRLTLDGNKLPGPAAGLATTGSTLTTVGAGTITAAQVASKLITRSGPTTAFTDTTDTAALIIANLRGFVTEETKTLGAGWQVNETFRITYLNTTAFACTLAAGTGVTLSGEPIIPANSYAEILLTMSSATAVAWNVLYCGSLSGAYAASEVSTAISTAGNGTLTAAALVGGVLDRSGPSANYTDTTDTAAAIISAWADAAVGNTMEITIRNTVGYIDTLAAGAGVTLSGLTAIPPLMSLRALITYTAAGAVTIKGLFVTSLDGTRLLANTAISTAGAGTLTAAGLAGQYITRTGPTAAYSDATDTAANIIAAMPDAQVNQTMLVWIENNVGFYQTITAGASVTLGGVTIVPPYQTLLALLQVTGASTVTITGLMTTNAGNKVLDQINQGFVRSSAQLDAATNTTLAAITGLSVPLQIGTYKVRAHLPCTSGASGGVKVSLDTSDTLALTSSDQTGYINNTAVASAIVHTTAGLTTAIGATQVAMSVEIEATLVVSTAGTLIVKGAQNGSNGTTTSFYVGGTLEVTRIA